MQTGTNNISEASSGLVEKTREGTGRIEAFSDGVFAIAITLLILEVKVPEIKAGHLAEELLHLWPSYFGFLISFVVIGIVWINHHNTFKLVERSDHNFLVLNLFLLLGVSFIPFPTAVLAESIRENHEQQVAAILYSGTMLAVGLAYNFLWRYASHKYRLISSEISPGFLKKLMVRYNLGVAVYAVAFGLSFLSYEFSMGLIVLVAVFFLLPDNLFTGRAVA